MEQRRTTLAVTAWLVTLLALAGGVAQVAWFAAGGEAPWELALVVWCVVWAGALPLTPAVGQVMTLAVAMTCLFNEWFMYRVADAAGADGCSGSPRGWWRC